MAKPTPRFTVDQMYTALDKNGGFFYLAARALDCAEITIERYVAKHQRLRDLVKQHRGQRKDTIEGVLWNKAQAGEAWAVCFFLKTQCRDRGYTERIEFKEVKDMSDDELREAIKRRIGAVVGDVSGIGPTEPAPPTVH